MYEDIKIRKMEEHSYKEWEGVPSCILYLGGCNMRCPYCNMKDLVLNYKNMEVIPFEKIKEFLLSNKKWVEGVVISGGEPSLNRGLVPLLQELKRMDFKIKLLTNGSNEPLIRKIMLSKLVDVITLDVKAPLVDKNYRDTTKSNVDIRNIRNLITFLKGSSFQYEISVTPVPGLMKEEDFERILASLVGVKTLVIRQFNPVNTIDPSFEKVEPYSREYLEMLCKKAERAVRKCMLR